MEIGIFSRTYPETDLDRTIAKMKRDGIRHTQFNLTNCGMDTLPETAEEDAVRKTAQTLAQAGIVVDALSGTFNMIDPDPEKRRAGIRQFALQCRIAEWLGSPIVSLCTGSKNPESKWKWHDENRSEKAWSDLLRTTEQLLKNAEESHVILGVETEASNVVCTPMLARKYLDTFRSPNLKIIMDGANLYHPGQKVSDTGILREAFALLGKDIVLAHAKDIRGAELLAGEEPSFAAAGEGDLNFPSYIRMLLEAGYRGALIMHGLSEQQIPYGKAYLSQIIQKETEKCRHL